MAPAIRVRRRRGAVGMDEIDEAPALALVELARETGHRAVIHAVRDPPEEIAVAVLPEMLGGEVGRLVLDARSGGSVAASAGAVARGAMRREKLRAGRDRA